MSRATHPSPTTPAVFPLVYTAPVEASARTTGADHRREPVPSPASAMGELYVHLDIGGSPVWALVDTGSSVLFTVATHGLSAGAVSGIPPTARETYVHANSRTAVAETRTNRPLDGSCGLVRSETCALDGDAGLSACAFARSARCELHFGTGSLMYTPVRDSVAFRGTLLWVPDMYIAAAEEATHFPFPISALLGLAHYRHAGVQDTPGLHQGHSLVHSLCLAQPHATLLNRAAATYQLVAVDQGADHDADVECLARAQRFCVSMIEQEDATIRGELVLRADVPPTGAITLAMVPGLLPFYALELHSVRVGDAAPVSMEHQVVILDHGTSGGGSWDPVVHDVLVSASLKPIALTFGAPGTTNTFTVVLEARDYMLAHAPDDDGVVQHSSIFARSGVDMSGGDALHVSVAGNLVLKNLAVQADLAADTISLWSVKVHEVASTPINEGTGVHRTRTGVSPGTLQQLTTRSHLSVMLPHASVGASVGAPGTPLGPPLGTCCVYTSAPNDTQLGTRGGPQSTTDETGGTSVSAESQAIISATIGMGIVLLVLAIAVTGVGIAFRRARRRRRVALRVA